MSYNMLRNTMDEDWDERRDGGKDVPEKNLSDFTSLLETGGCTHTSYYHYTNWDALGKMMEEVKGGPARGLRMLLLSRASNTNDRQAMKFLAREMKMECSFV